MLKATGKATSMEIACKSKNEFPSKRNSLSHLNINRICRVPTEGNPVIDLEASTGFEPVIRVLQTLALPAWPRRHLNNRAGDGIRTHDLLLGKETFYH
jgi:hypothetical protein